MRQPEVSGQIARRAPLGHLLPGVVWFYPARAAFRRLQDLHAIATGPPLAALPIVTSEARKAFSRSTLMALGQFAVLSDAGRAAFFSGLLDYVLSDDSIPGLDGLESLFLTGLNHVSRVGLEDPFGEALSFWKDLGDLGDTSTLGGLPFTIVFDGFSQSLTFLAPKDVETLSKLNPGGGIHIGESLADLLTVDDGMALDPAHDPSAYADVLTGASCSIFGSAVKDKVQADPDPETRSLATVILAVAVGACLGVAAIAENAPAIEKKASDLWSSLKDAASRPVSKAPSAGTPANAGAAPPAPGIPTTRCRGMMTLA